VANPLPKGEALPQSSLFAYRSCRIKQACELTLIIITDFLDRERVFTLAQQQELIGPHPHNFVWRGKPAGRNVPADALRRPGAIFAPARTA